jgi:hypothetical protein
MTIKALYPSIRPSLDLNFARTRALDPRITFTRDSTGTFVGSNGLVQTAASGVPRFDFNPTTGESLGLLVEEARTNIIVSSSVFNTGGWAQDGVVLTANTGVAPDGTTTATSVSQGTGGNRCFHFDNSGVTGSKVFSFFAKANAGTSFQVVAVGSQSPNSTATVNLSSGTVSGFTGATIQPYANGWYRVFLPVTVTTASGSSTYWQFFGPASSVFLWGIQLEAGASPTSYIPTTGATVTRVADVAQITGNNFLNWYNQSQGTFVHSGRFVGDVVSGTYGRTNGLLFRVFNSGLNTFSNQAWAGGARFNGASLPAGLSAGLYNGSTVYGIDSAAQQFNVPVGSRMNVAMFIDNSTNFIGTAFNGQSVDTVGITSSPTWNSLSLSEAYNGEGRCGTVSRFTYYPTRLSNAQLQALTQ